MLQPVTIPTEVATKAGTTLIETGVLGTLLVVAILAICALVWLLVKVQNLRVADTKELAALSQQMVSTFAQVNGTLASLNADIKTQASALQVQTTTLNTLLMSSMSRAGTIPPGHPQLPPGGT